MKVIPNTVHVCYYNVIKNGTYLLDGKAVKTKYENVGAYEQFVHLKELYFVWIIKQKQYIGDSLYAF